jgi:hypothetical protein
MAIQLTLEQQGMNPAPLEMLRFIQKSEALLPVLRYKEESL